jgi:hypothetical protein
MSSATITTEKNNHGNVAKGLVGHVKANRKSCGKPCVKPCGRPVPGKVHKKKDRITPQVNFFQKCARNVVAGTGNDGKTNEEVEERWCVAKLCV